jgi:RimJ/RimL family protein N-acetyltransferase
MMVGPTPLDMLRALVDPLRLAVAGDSVSGPVSIKALVERTGVTKRDVVKAIGDLRSIGLLDEDGALSQDVLRAIGQELPKEPGPQGTPVEGPWTPSEAQTLGRFFAGERLVELPSNSSKRRLVVEKIAQGFEPGRRYPERDVNFKIQLIHADYAAIRRYMVEEGFMDRADGAYWRTGGRYDASDAVETVKTVQKRSDTTLPTSLPGVELRPYEWSMVEGLIAAADDERIPRYMGDQFASPYTRDDAENWLEIATKNDPPTQYAIFIDGVLSGGCGAFVHGMENTGVAEIGWWLHPDHWGRGVTSAAVCVLIDELFEHRGLMRLWAPVMHANPASVRVAEKAGMRFEGVAASQYLKHGVRYDQLNYGLTRSQWLAGR